MAALVALLPVDLAPDQFRKTLPQINGGHQQLAKTVLARIAGEEVEKIGGIRADLFITRNETKVCVESRRGRIIVTSGQVHVAPDGFAFAADHQRDLGMDLEPQQSVYNVHAF